MNRFEEIVLKKRSITFHIIVGYLTGGIWVLIYFITKYMYKNKMINIVSSQKTQSSPQPIYNKTFNVAGISFHNRELKEIIQNGIKVGEIEKFDGMTRKERIEYCDLNNSIGEYQNQEINVELNKTIFKNKDAIEVLADNFYGNKVLIGYVPKKELLELLPIIDKNVLIWATIVGGKIYYFDEDKENDEYEELELGIELLVKIYEKRNQ